MCFFSMLSFLCPLGFGLASVVLLTGHHFWQSATGWVMAASLALGVLALALSFVYFVVGQTPHDRLHQVSRWLNISLSVLLAIGLQLTLPAGNHLRTGAFTVFIVIACGITLVQLVSWLTARERYMWWFMSLLGMGAPVLLALANRPYLLFPNVQVQEAYSAETYGVNMAVSLVLVLVVVIWLVVLLAKRVLSTPATPVKP